MDPGCVARGVCPALRREQPKPAPNDERKNPMAKPSPWIASRIVMALAATLMSGGSLVVGGPDGGAPGSAPDDAAVVPSPMPAADTGSGPTPATDAEAE